MMASLLSFHPSYAAFCLWWWRGAFLSFMFFNSSVPAFQADPWQLWLLHEGFCEPAALMFMTCILCFVIDGARPRFLWWQIICMPLTDDLLSWRFWTWAFTGVCVVMHPIWLLAFAAVSMLALCAYLYGCNFCILIHERCGFSPRPGCPKVQWCSFLVHCSPPILLMKQ